MGKFCGYCGTKLEDGAECMCEGALAARAAAQVANAAPVQGAAGAPVFSQATATPSAIQQAPTQTVTGYQAPVTPVASVPTYQNYAQAGTQFQGGASYTKVQGVNSSAAGGGAQQIINNLKDTFLNLWKAPYDSAARAVEGNWFSTGVVAVVINTICATIFQVWAANAAISGLSGAVSGATRSSSAGAATSAVLSSFGDFVGPLFTWLLTLFAYYFIFAAISSGMTGKQTSVKHIFGAMSVPAVFSSVAILVSALLMSLNVFVGLMVLFAAGLFDFILQLYAVEAAAPNADNNKVIWAIFVAVLVASIAASIVFMVGFTATTVSAGYSSASTFNSMFK